MSKPTPETPPIHLLDIVEKLDSLTGEEVVSVADVARAFGPAAFVPMLMVPALMVVSPLSGIPLFSTICGLTITLIASQLLIGRRMLWLPGFLMRRQISGERLHDGVSRVRGVVEWIDRHTRDRMTYFVTGRSRMLVYLLCTMCGLAMPFLEVVPFSSSILGMALLCFSAALLATDGLFIVLGLCFVLAASVVPTLVVGGLFAI